ncbi:MAG: valine--tRNA ligase [Planctomycetes bacterium]|nr:valine--tRNA ligase [Planctomycetota bacterium]
MTAELPTRYDPTTTQEPIYERWLAEDSFAAVPTDSGPSYVVMMPLPNVTGALHMGHAMDNVMQDMLTRWHRMLGDDTLWQPGTDHAGIATQSLVEQRLFDLEGKTRKDLGREGLVSRIWEWKEEYQKRIIHQQQQMGCSCDWKRQRFTMDAVCTAAVREFFFRMYRDGLIYRGNRLVNWDCFLQTAVADDEVEHKKIAGKFWHLRYPVRDPQPGEPEHVIVATTRPETMLGDVAVAVHPEPAAELDRLVAAQKERIGTVPAKERADAEAELARLETRRDSDLARLETLVRMAQDGRSLVLPLMDREIPLILDTWAKPALGSGCVKITPAHDPNDYEVWQRHKDRIHPINILEPNGTLNANAGSYAGLDRFDARKRVVADLEKLGLLERVEEREIELGHSDRSKTPIEPWLSKQWFVRMSDVPGGIVMGAGTDNEHRAAGLAQAAIDATEEAWTSPTGRQLTFWPDPRYRNSYRSWLAEKRDWCISRQLWWGHRIPIWRKAVRSDDLARELDALPALDPELACLQIDLPSGERADRATAEALPSGTEVEIQVCLREAATEALGPRLEAAGLAQDPDVLDTWFSSALWPESTLGWPDPAHAGVESGQRDLTTSLARYYPGSCLVTGRDIITLWVARMVLAGLYNLGDLPFTDVFIHATILDGNGVRMSKSRGNGIDPVDIIDRYGADAMRYVLCEMQTGLQDIRLPVQAISPFSGEGQERLVDLASAKSTSRGVYVDPENGNEFDVIGMRKDLPQAKVISDRFEVGRNFCNKLWNAVRFALLNLGDGEAFRSLSQSELAVEDRWILSRLARCTKAVDDALGRYDPSTAIGAAREFFWTEFCDWYLELLKPRMAAGGDGRAIGAQVLAYVLDQTLRLLHPFVPFITETLWEHLSARAPVRGIEAPLEQATLLIRAAWPVASEGAIDAAMEADFERVQVVVRGLRDLRAKYAVPPKKLLACSVRATGELAGALERFEAHVRHLAGLETFSIGADTEKPKLAATFVVGAGEVFLEGVLDPAAERARLEKDLGKLRGAADGLASRLENPSFVERAPKEVVAKERARLEEMRMQVQALENAMKELGD